MTRQAKVKGLVRIPSASSLHPDIRRELETCARRHQVSMSFVQAVALADHFGIDIERYERPRRKRRKK